GGDEFWTELGDSQIHYEGNEVSIGPDPDNRAVRIIAAEEGTGYMRVANDIPNDNRGSAYIDARFGHYGFNESNELTYWMGTHEEDADGFIQLLKGDEVTIEGKTLNSGAGLFRAFGPNGNTNVVISTLLDNPNNGFLSLRNPGGETRAAAYVDEDGSGQVFTRGPNGNLNVNMTFLNSNVDHGYVAVYDSGGDEEAGLYVDQAGRGVVFADVKNFRSPYPNDDSREIVYASLEGPEAGAYLRGTAQLVDGNATVLFPDHFKYIASDLGMTVMITPLSASSKGVAVIKKSEEGFEAVELHQGRGTYLFDWEVKAKRRGFENYQPVRHRHQANTNLRQATPLTYKTASRPIIKNRRP
ncbi:MAG: hypothetical protein AAFR14_12295, partial [Bacteroidota bacterium]